MKKSTWVLIGVVLLSVWASANYKKTTFKRTTVQDFKWIPESSIDMSLDYKQKSSLQNEVKDLFNAGEFSMLENLVSKIRSHRERFDGGDWKLEHFYMGLRTAYKDLETSQMIAKEDGFHQWIAAYPGSVTARIAWADYLKELAWRYRGDGYADTVSPKENSKFNEILLMIPVIFEEVKNLPEKDPHLFAVMITVGNGIGIDKKELYYALEEGLIMDPEYFPLYLRMTTVLLRRWQGDPGEVKQFAEGMQKATQATHGYMLYALIADKIFSYEGWADIKKTKLSWEKIQLGFEELLSKYPGNFYYLNSYAAFACIYEDKTLAKVLLERIGDTWDGSSQAVWKEKKYLDNHKRLFIKK